MALRLEVDNPSSAVATDHLSRNVYGILGLSLDVLNFPSLLRLLESAVVNASPFMISTPNVNFLITSHKDSAFRKSIVESDLCLADGMPLIWIAKLLRVPLTERIAGSDLFGRLKAGVGKSRQLRVFLLGGAEGVAEAVCKKLNEEQCGLKCVGVLNPGFGSIEEMSSAQVIETINATQADLLAVFFGAQKAQAWLMLNHRRLTVPVRAQFGATVNFEAGIVKRAPLFMRSTGFEWLWRIKEEPYLWRRYWGDGKALLKLIFTCVLPLVLEAYLKRDKPGDLEITVEEVLSVCTVHLSGDAVAKNVDLAISHFRRALSNGKNVVIELSKVRSIDSRMFGLLLMAKKCLADRGLQMTVLCASPAVLRSFRLNRFEFLLSKKCDSDDLPMYPVCCQPRAE